MEHGGLNNHFQVHSDMFSINFDKNTRSMLLGCLVHKLVGWVCDCYRVKRPPFVLNEHVTSNVWLRV